MKTHATGINRVAIKAEPKRISRPQFWKLAHERGAMTEAERVASIKSGFTVSWADAARLEFQISTQNMGDLLNLSTATYERRRKDAKPLDVAASERLDRIASVALIAEELFEDRDAATRWMAAPNQALGGNTPVMHCETEIGARQVRRILNALEWGGVV